MSTNPLADLEDIVERMTTDLPMRSGGIRVDLIDDVEDLVLLVDLPGVDREEIDLTLKDRRLTIDVRPSDQDSPEDEGRYIRRERRKKAASRTISLPDLVDPDAVEATLESGVLNVTLPKQAGGSGHRIDVD